VFAVRSARPEGCQPLLDRHRADLVVPRAEERLGRLVVVEELPVAVNDEDRHVEVWEETFSQSATMLEGIRVDYYGAMPPESALEAFRRSGSEIGIKPTHLAGFTRAEST
jgi:hypothetical protein